MRRLLFGVLLVIAGFVALVWAGQFGMGPVIVTPEYESKIVLRFGRPVKILTAPGLAFRVPLLDEVLTFDKRLQYLNAQPVEMLIARGEKLIIDFYAVWRITDPLAFRRAFPRGMQQAAGRIQETVNALVGAKVGGLELVQLLQRAEDLHTLDEEGSARLVGSGVEIVDVRINRTEIPSNAEPAAYQQMREQRRALARDARVKGEREGRRIRAESEREARTTRARARAWSETTRGEGDAEAARIYADAYSQDPEFYAFVRSLEAYRTTIGPRTTMVLPPDHEFFRFLQPDSEKALVARPAPAVTPTQDAATPGDASPESAPASD